MSKLESMVVLKRLAEQCFVNLIKVLDDQNALKMRDEFLGFRRRMRLFVGEPREPYRSHLQDTVEKLPEYATWLDGEADRFGVEAGHKCRRLLEVLQQMLKRVEPDFPLDKPADRAIVETPKPWRVEWPARKRN